MQQIAERSLESPAQGVRTDEPGRVDVLRLALAGMERPTCAKRIRSALLRTSGVLRVEVDLPTALARVWHDRAIADTYAIIGAVTCAGEGTQHRYLAIPVPPVYGG